MYIVVCSEAYLFGIDLLFSSSELEPVWPLAVLPVAVLVPVLAKSRFVTLPISQ